MVHRLATYVSPDCTAAARASSLETPIWVQTTGRRPSLTARLLRLVNSAFYGFVRRIDTVSRAIAIIGVFVWWSRRRPTEH